MGTIPFVPSDFGLRLRQQLQRLFLWTSLSIATTLQAQEAPTLQGILNAEKTAIRLELQGRAEVNYEIQASSDLIEWTPVASGQVGNGVLLNEQTLAGHHRYFRGRESGSVTNEPTLPSVAPLMDTNATVNFLVTTNGGSATLYSRGGTQFTFTVPPLTVVEPELITMTLVTNLGNLPFSQGVLGAIRLEPDGLALWGAGTLEISLPSELDLRGIVSFAAQGDGSSFHLTPDRVNTNAVLIPVTQLGLFGSAPALDTELGPLSSSAAAGLPTSSGVLTAQGGACFPDRAADARRQDQLLDGLTQQYSRRLASALNSVRRQAADGRTGDSFDPEAAARQVSAVFCSIVTDSVGPFLTAAAANCELSKVLIRHMRGLRQLREILRIPEDPRCPTSFSVCEMRQNCLREVKECCDRGIRGAEQIAVINQMVTQDRMTGVECLTAADIDQAIDACAPGKWTGTLTLKIDGRRSKQSQPAPRNTVTELETDMAEFQGHIIDSIEVTYPGGTNATLTVSGEGFQTKSETIIRASEGDCGGSFIHEYTGWSARGPAVFTVIVTMDEGQPARLGIFPTPGANPTMPGVQNRHTYSQFGVRSNDRCQLVTDSDSSSGDWQAVLVGTLFDEPAPFQDNQLTGGGNMNAVQMELPGTGRFEWRFSRHPERP